MFSSTGWCMPCISTSLAYQRPGSTPSNSPLTSPSCFQLPLRGKESRFLRRLNRALAMGCVWCVKRGAPSAPDPRFPKAPWFGRPQLKEVLASWPFWGDKHLRTFWMFLAPLVTFECSSRDAFRHDAWVSEANLSNRVCFCGDWVLIRAFKRFFCRLLRGYQIHHDGVVFVWFLGFY